MADKMACTVPNCCFCADLRTGSVIIGYVGLVFSIIGSIIFMVALSATIRWTPSSVIAINAINLCFSLIRFMFMIVLLMGIHQYNRKYVKAFLVYGVTFTMLTIALFITSVILNPSVLDIIINIIDILLTIYFLVVIRSYYLSDYSKAPRYPVVQPNFVVQQPQYVMHQQPQFVINARPQYVMPQPPQYMMPQPPQYVVAQQQNVVQQEPPPMYTK